MLLIKPNLNLNNLFLFKKKMNSPNENMKKAYLKKCIKNGINPCFEIISALGPFEFPCKNTFELNLD